MRKAPRVRRKRGSPDAADGLCLGALHQHGRSLQPKRRDRSLAAARAPRGVRRGAGPHTHLDVDTRSLRLTVYVDGKPYRSYPVGVGRPSRFALRPVGEWKTVHQGVNWGGGFGARWLGLNVPWRIYGIHGTNKPSSIGTR